MFLRDIFKISMINALRGKMRTLLTILSITIGIASVLLVSSIGSTGEKLVINEIEKMGLEGISIYKQSSEDGAGLRADDIAKLRRRFKNITAATPIVMEMGSFKFSSVVGSAVLIGVGEESTFVYNIHVLHGRIPTKADMKAKKRIAVVDNELATKTYGRTNVIGKRIKIEIGGNSEEFEIIAVIKSQKDGINQMFGNNLPDFIYLPYTTLNDMRGSEEISQITLKTSENNENGENFATYLNKISGENAYISENISSKMDEVKSITGMISLLITTIAAIALCVAGIGIMNSMFSSCVERRKEIGICMAIGARFSDILFCFLCEAVIISVIGGAFGAAIGILCGNSVSSLINIEFSLNLKTFFIAEIISVAFGIVFSLLPAIKAARMDPIAALRRD